MAIIRFRDEDGSIKELACLKGDPGSGGASNAKDVAYDGEHEYITADNVETALKKTSDAIVRMEGDINDKTSYGHTHDAGEVEYGSRGTLGILNVGAALDHLFVQVGDVSSALDELHTYAQALVNGGGAE